MFECMKCGSNFNRYYYNKEGNLVEVCLDCGKKHYPVKNGKIINKDEEEITTDDMLKFCDEKIDDLKLYLSMGTTCMEGIEEEIRIYKKMKRKIIELEKQSVDLTLLCDKI